MLQSKGYAVYANSKVQTASPAELTLMLYEVLQHSRDGYREKRHTESTR